MTRRDEFQSQSLLIDNDLMDILEGEFSTLKSENYIDKKDLKKAFELLNFSLPGHEIRELEKNIPKEAGDKISGEILMMLYAQVKQNKDKGRLFKVSRRISEDTNLKTFVNEKKHKAETIHTVSFAEEQAFSGWINRVLAKDNDSKKYLPIEVTEDDSSQLYQKCGDGLLLCKLINTAVKETIDERTINKAKEGQTLSVFKRNENLNLLVNSAASIGCCVVNIGPEDISNETHHLVLGLIWQVIRIGLLGLVNVNYHPDIVALLEDYETLDDLKALSPEELLLRWVNYHLKNAGVDRRINNFKDDIMDSVAYTHLLDQVFPVDKREEMIPNAAILNTNDPEARAEKVLKNADIIDMNAFVNPVDIAKANIKGTNRDRLNLAFVANLFNNYPGFEKQDIDMEIIEETLEEKTYRNWMNSLGVTPFVKYLYADLKNGLVLLQLFDILKPGVVNWSKVTRDFNPKKKMFQMQGNCQEVLRCAGEIKTIKVVNLSGDDIYKGEQKLILGLVFQMMRTYTIQLLTQLSGNDKPIEDKDIINWANVKYGEKESDTRLKTTSIAGFKDPSLATGIPVIDLVEILCPGIVRFDVVSDDNESNCKYAISIARKIGARIYALPQHLEQVNMKMIMTIYASLMALDLAKSKQ